MDSLTDPGAVMPGLEYLDALGVKVVAGPSIDLFGSGVSEFASDRGMLLLSCCSVTLESAIPGDNLYRMTPNQTHHGIILADIMYEGGKTLVVPVGRNSAWVTDLLESAVERFTERGGEAADMVVYDTYGEFGEGLARMNDMVREAGDALGYDRVAVLYVGFEETFELIRDAAGYGGLAGVQWFGADANTLLHDHPLDAAASVNFTVVQPVSLGDQRSAALGERLAQELGRLPSVYAYQQYDAVWLLGMAILGERPNRHRHAKGIPGRPPTLGGGRGHCLRRVRGQGFGRIRHMAHTRRYVGPGRHHRQRRRPAALPRHSQRPTALYPGAPAAHLRTGGPAGSGHMRDTGGPLT